MNFIRDTPSRSPDKGDDLDVPGKKQSSPSIAHSKRPAPEYTKPSPFIGRPLAPAPPSRQALHKLEDPIYIDIDGHKPISNLVKTSSVASKQRQKRASTSPDEYRPPYMASEPRRKRGRPTKKDAEDRRLAMEQRQQERRATLRRTTGSSPVLIHPVLQTATGLEQEDTSITTNLSQDVIKKEPQDESIDPPPDGPHTWGWEYVRSQWITRDGKFVVTPLYSESLAPIGAEKQQHKTTLDSNPPTRLALSTTSRMSDEGTPSELSDDLDPTSSGGDDQSEAHSIEPRLRGYLRDVLRLAYYEIESAFFGTPVARHHWNERARLEDNDNRTSSPASNLPSKDSGKTSRVEQYQNSTSKGKESEDKQNNDSDDGNAGPPRHPKRTRNFKPRVSELRLACPFFQNNPTGKWEDRSCRGPGWEASHRVKEHVYRRHALPIHCHRCNDVFETENDLTAHSKMTKPCRVAEEAQLIGVNKDQEKKLRSRKKTPGRTEVERWVEIYKILFPNSDIPSPYCEPSTHTEYQRLSRFKDYIVQEMPLLMQRKLDNEMTGIPEEFRSIMSLQMAGFVRTVAEGLFGTYSQLESTNQSGPTELPGKAQREGDASAGSITSAQTLPRPTLGITFGGNAPRSSTTHDFGDISFSPSLGGIPISQEPYISSSFLEFSASEIDEFHESFSASHPECEENWPSTHAQASTRRVPQGPSDIASLPHLQLIGADFHRVGTSASGVNLARPRGDIESRHEGSMYDGIGLDPRQNPMISAHASTETSYGNINESYGLRADDPVDFSAETFPDHCWNDDFWIGQRTSGSNNTREAPQ